MLRRILASAAALAMMAAPAQAEEPASAPKPPPLEAYGDLPGVEDMAISPDGTGLAFIAKVEGKRMLVVTGDGGKSVRGGAALEDTKVHSVNWAGNDIVWLYTSSTQNLGYGFTSNKHEFYGAILLYPESGKVDAVFKGRANIANAIFGMHGTRTVDGKLLGYFEGIELQQSAGRNGYVFDHGRPALFAVDLAKNKPSKIAPSAGENHWRDWLVGADGRIAATLDVSSNTGKWEIENVQHLTLASGVDAEGDVSLVSLGKTPATII